jgi:hypothetical protein
MPSFRSPADGPLAASGTLDPLRALAGLKIEKARRGGQNKRGCPVPSRLRRPAAAAADKLSEHGFKMEQLEELYPIAEEVALDYPD